MEYKIDLNILKAVLDYLAKQPYNEVNLLINELIKAQPIEAKKEEK